MNLDPQKIPAYIVKELVWFLKDSVIKGKEVCYYDVKLSIKSPIFKAAIRGYLVTKKIDILGIPVYPLILEPWFYTAHGKIELIKRYNEIKEHEKRLRNRRTRLKKPMQPK